MMNKQAVKGIEQVFTSIGRFSKSLIKEFVQHLENNLNLEENEKTLTDKLKILSSLKRRLPDKSFDTFEIIYGFIEIKLPRLRCLEKEAIDNSLLEIALTEVFEHQRTHKPPCNMNKLDQLYAARNIRIADKKKSGVYASLGVLLDKSVEEIKTKCIKYLKSEIFPLEQKEVKSILRENKTIGSHISSLESSDEGGPFIFYAASKVYQHYIHVLCAAEERLEEYVFYPSELPSKRASCGHMFIGHLSGYNYVSLDSTDPKLRKRNEELERKIREYETIIEKLKEEIRENKKENSKLKEEIEEYKHMVEQLKEEIRGMDSKYATKHDLQLLHKKLEENKLSFQRQISSLSSTNDSTNSEEIMDRGQGKQENHTEDNRKAQVARNAKNDKQREKQNKVETHILASSSAGKAKAPQMTTVENPEWIP